MTIDEAMNHIKYGIIENNYPLQRDLGIEACNLAIDTMRKYQKIEEILDQLVDSKIRTYDAVTEIEDIVYGQEVVEDDDKD